MDHDPALFLLPVTVEVSTTIEIVWENRCKDDVFLSLKIGRSQRVSAEVPGYAACTIFPLIANREEVLVY
jgi:hypothetical protein